uniref:Nuclear receptor domain-containing protein n=1 Tax=Panagrolaimus superbus TaxID=310955 RepID=A0A914YSW9_9BILA
MIQKSSDNKKELSDILPGNGKPKCVVCGEFTDGQHFGQYSCRACAAFFRRTVATSSKYICKFDQNCEISKDIRNYCRFCRYQKCVDVGMIADGNFSFVAVQIHRDTYGKRNLPTLEDPTPPKSTNEYLPDNRYSTLETMQTDPSKQPNNQHQTSMVLKRLTRMTNGYQKFRSLRKASFSLFMDEPRFVDNDVRIL